MHAAPFVADEHRSRPSAPRPQGKILIVDDLPKELLTNTVALQAYGYTTRDTGSPDEALQIAAEWRPDLIVLDVNMPECDGFTLCRRMRENGSDALFIFVSALQAMENKLFGLEMAEDYITKPFDAQEFVARVGVALRRRERDLEAQGSYGAATFSLDLVNRVAHLANGHTVSLSPNELRILVKLMEARSRVVPFRDLMRDENDRAALQVYIRRLRCKLETDSSKPKLIVLKPRVGYYFAGAR